MKSYKNKVQTVTFSVVFRQDYTITFLDEEELSKNKIPSITVGTAIEGSHTERTMFLEAMGRDRENAYVVLKEAHIHTEQTAIRVQMEKQLLMKTFIDPLTTETQAVYRNKTFYSKGHTIKDDYNSEIKNLVECYKKIPDSFFTPEAPRSLYINQEIKALKIDIFNAVKTKGLTKKQFLLI